MALEHEYAVLGGYNRTHVGRWLYRAAALLSGLIVFALLSAVDLARAFGLNVNLPPTVLSLLGAGAVYGVLYWVFDRYGWKFSPLSRILRVPDLSGNWVCEAHRTGRGSTLARSSHDRAVMGSAPHPFGNRSVNVGQHRSGTAVRLRSRLPLDVPLSKPTTGIGAQPFAPPWLRGADLCARREDCNR